MISWSSSNSPPIQMLSKTTYVLQGAEQIPADTGRAVGCTLDSWPVHYRDGTLGPTFIHTYIPISTENRLLQNAEVHKKRSLTS